MSDREKLMKLLADADAAAIEHCNLDCGCVGCEYRSVAFCCDAFVADYLLEHGVTFATDKNDVCKKTSKQKTRDILDWVQSTAEVDWGFMCCLKQELEQLVAIASGNDAVGR